MSAGAAGEPDAAGRALSAAASRSWLRLKTRAQYQAVLKNPPAARTTHFALHRLAWSGSAAVTPAERQKPVFTPASGVWLGAMAPKRWARRAVTRNAIRRQIYALGQQKAGGWPAGAWLVRLRAGFDRSQFPSASSTALKRAVRSELVRLFARALPSANTKPAADSLPPGLS